jgi:hypothetical protein
LEGVQAITGQAEPRGITGRPQKSRVPVFITIGMADGGDPGIQRGGCGSLNSVVWK